MSGKPTSLAAQLARDDAAQKIVEAKEDLDTAQLPTPDGKIWVRLERPCYDASGVYHQIGLALLDADAVPPSAKKLTKADALGMTPAAASDED